MGEKINKENARELGRKGGLERQRRARELKELTPEQRATKRITDVLNPLTDKLIDAALRRGDFADQWDEDDGKRELLREGINPELQMKALLAALAYGIGRPSTRKPETAVPPEDTGETEGITFGAEETDSEAEAGEVPEE